MTSNNSDRIDRIWAPSLLDLSNPPSKSSPDSVVGVNKARLVKMIEVSTTGEDSKTKERLIVREYWTVDGILIGRIVRPLPLNPGSRGDESAIH